MSERRDKAIARIGVPTKSKSTFIIVYTLVFCVLGLILSIYFLDAVQPLEWLIIPVTFVVANVVEYLIHRFPMHHKYPGAAFMCELHMEHHNYFSEKEYSIEKYEDFYPLIFPAFILNSMTLFIVLPIGYVLFIFLGMNVALLFSATVMVYYILMQVFHSATHTKREHWVNSIPGLGYLWNHHFIHHDFTDSFRHNFNFILPIADFIFRTKK